MTFRDELEQATVGDLPLRDVISVPSGAPVRKAVSLMREKSLGCAVIVDPDGNPVALFTEQSLLDLLAQNDSLDDHPVDEYTDPAYRVLGVGEPAMRVWDAVEKEGLRFIFVADADGKLIGVTGQRGISEYLAEDFPEAVLAQRLGSTPWMQQREGA